VLVLLLGILTLIGLPFGITLWECLKLLIIPVVIAAGGLWFNRHQREREQYIGDQRAQDEALQTYLDQIGQLLLDKDRPLRQSKEGDEVRTLARARTLTVLARLESSRKGTVVQFLYEANLIAGKVPQDGRNGRTGHGRDKSNGKRSPPPIHGHQKGASFRSQRPT
jgi:hypothetical protein